MDTFDDALSQGREYPFSKPTPLQSLQIIGLFGNLDLTLRFSNAYTVFVADNGSGKTISLSFLQGILRNDFAALLRYKFSEFVITFKDDSNTVRIPYAALVPKDLGRWARNLRVTRNVAPEIISRAMNLTGTLSYEQIRFVPEFRLIAERSTYPSRYVYDRLRDLAAHQLVAERSNPDLLDQAHASEMKRLTDIVARNFPLNVVYLPTYRRIEQALRYFLKVNDEPAELSGLIHFGMKDIHDKINSVTQKIRDHFVQSYGQISGQMLGQLTEKIEITEKMRDALANERDVSIVLSRVGQNISTSVRERILTMTRQHTLVNNQYLAFFMLQLIEAYGAVKDLDESMQDFANVCNRYLINKEFRYNSATATLQLYNKLSNDMLDLEGLSSGEKQLIGMMAELYLAQGERYAVIIDEPELSLSVEWQKNILPDIIQSGRCDLLVAATHSPFIFENKLDRYARDLVARYKPAAAQ